VEGGAAWVATERQTPFSYEIFGNFQDTRVAL
jgi:hypothetical protein